MRKTDSTKYRGKTDLEFVEGYIERLNIHIDKLPTEIIFQTKKDEPLFEVAYIEPGKVIAWGTEDIEYAQTCEREKWLSRGY